MLDKVYSDSFIFDCADLYKVYENETLHLIKTALEQNRLQIWIFEADQWLENIRPLRNGSESERFIYQKVMSWFSGSKLRKLPLNSLELPGYSNCMCTSIWLETEEQEQQIIHFLNHKGLLSLIKEELLSNNVSWLFKIVELPTINFGRPFNWNDYLATYSHYTRKLFLFDRYFYYNWHRPIQDLVGEFFEINSNLQIEIVGELDEDNRSYPYAMRNIDLIKSTYPGKISFYKFQQKIGQDHHDRYLMTDYCLIKSEPGFSLTRKNQKSIRETTPTIIGRYSSDSHKWRNEYFNWEQKKAEYFSLIEVAGY